MTLRSQADAGAEADATGDPDARRAEEEAEEKARAKREAEEKVAATERERKAKRLAATGSRTRPPASSYRRRHSSTTRATAIHAGGFGQVHGCNDGEGQERRGGAGACSSRHTEPGMLQAPPARSRDLRCDALSRVPHVSAA